MARYKPLLMAIASGLLLFAAWPVSPVTMIIFFAWVPLLWMESIVKSRKRFFWLTYITMFIWNISTTWWIWNASPPGAIAAFFANSLLMVLPWLGFRIAKKWMGQKMGYLALIAFWMSFEYIHLQDWGLSWPWLTLGNVFAMRPEWVQWYEYTGTSGGTLWVLLSNILIFELFRTYQQEGRSKKYITLLGGWVFMFIIAVIIYPLLQKKEPAAPAQTNIVIVQPNIDPYEKVSEATGSFEGQLQRLIRGSEKAIDSNTVLLLWPETALYMSRGIEETTIKTNYFLSPFWDFLRRNHQVTLFTGIESFRVFPGKTKQSQEFNGMHYESYNGSMVVDSSDVLAFYHKSMLVPGVETLPWFLKFVSKWFEKFGGTGGGYAKQFDRTPLDSKKGFRIAPAICYESIYGEFMRHYIKNGANIICIITNDGWWGKTPGHKQHMNYARLRAIETRTWVARSANTGISCFIDPYGKVINPQPYDTEAAIKLNVPVESRSKTFFVRNGDILSKITAGLAFVLIIWIFVRKFRRVSRQADSVNDEGRIAGSGGNLTHQ